MTCEGKSFTFLWKLENINYCHLKEGEKITSPAFVVDAINGTKWNLRLYPRGDKDEKDVSYVLNREADSKGPARVRVKYELSFIAEDGSDLTSHGIAESVFSKGGAFGFRNMAKREDVFVTKRSIFLPQDTLIARCRMWKIVGEMTEDVRCTALTRFGVEKRSLEWNVKNFSTLELEKKCTYQIKSVQNDMHLMSVNLSLTGGLNTDGIIRFKLSLQDQAIKFSIVRIFLITDSGIRVECNQEEMWFNDPTECKEITFFYTKKKLLEEESMYLPNDTLLLLWEFAFSRGVISKESEKDQYGYVYSEVKMSDAQIIKNDNTDLLNCLVDDVKSAYDEHFLSDIKLKTNTSVFPAHKFILGVSSSVFKAMFSNDMKEKHTNCVNIEDLSDDTIGRMLLFIYTTRVEGLTWDGASHLYVAADKYAILRLKNVCSSFLKENLSPSNACEVLLLSDFHADGDLKSTVQDYILKNGKQIIKSDEWKLLMETNAKLAAETVCHLFK